MLKTTLTQSEINTKLDSLCENAWFGLLYGSPEDDFYSESCFPRINVSDRSYWRRASKSKKVNAKRFDLGPVQVEGERVTHAALFSQPEGGEPNLVFALCLEQIPELQKGQQVVFDPGQIVLVCINKASRRPRKAAATSATDYGVLDADRLED